MTERQYKDSGIEWIGDIPNDWDVKRIKYAVVEMGSGTTPSSDNSHFYGGDIPWIQSGDLYNTSLITKTSKTVTEQAFQSCSALKIFHKPYIVIAMYGASVGNVSMSLIDACTNQACCVIKPNANNNLAYLKYWLEICKTDFINKSVGGGQPNISQDKIREQAYICPSLEEQQSIVKYLDSKTASIDSAIQAQKDIVEKLKEYRQAVINEAVTKGLNPDAEMKDSGIEWIGEIPKSWEVMPNKYLMTKQKDLCPVYNGENILSLSMRGVYVRDPYDESGKRPKTYNGYQFVYDGDLLMCLFDIDVTPRCVGRVYDNGLTSPAYSRFVMNRKKANVDYYYYYYLALDFDKTLLHLAKNMRSSFTETDFGHINAPVPPIKEQQQIVEYLDSKTTTIDKAIEQKNAIIEKLEEYKKSIIYNAVTGKIDCRKDVIPE